MKRTLSAAVASVLLLAGLLGSHTAEAKPQRKGTFSHERLPAAPDGSYPSRSYWLYVPDKLAPVPSRALVTYLHGCTQTGEDAAAGVGWNELADEHGFIVVYPEQHVPELGELDGSGARCWNYGQAAAYPRGQGELESLAQITRTVAADHRASHDRSYLVGLSSGALMASAMAATYPDLYRGLASVAGCSYLCADPTGDLAYQRMGEHAQLMPTFVVTGSADYLTNPAMGELTVSQWLGTNDLADDGAHNGSISPVPSSVEHRNVDGVYGTDPASGDPCLHDFPRNPCPFGALGIAPYPATVRTYTDDTGRIMVEAWLVHGLSHNYSGGSFDGGFTDPYGPDITSRAWDFFTSHSASKP